MAAKEGASLSSNSGERAMESRQGANIFKFFEREKYYLIDLVGSLNYEIPVDFIKKVASYILEPKNVLINCFCLKELSIEWVNTINSLAYQLTCHNKKVGFIFVPDELKDLCHLTSLKFYQGTKDFFLDFYPEERALSFHFVKSLVYSTMRTLFIHGNTPSHRKNVYLRDNQAKLFLGDINGLIRVDYKEFFYLISLSFPGPTFLKIINSIGMSEADKINQEVKDCLDDLLKVILNQALNMSASNHRVFDISSTSIEAERKMPEVKFHFKGKEWKIFEGGISIVAHFLTIHGDFFVEIWFPREFERLIFSKN